MYRSLKKDKKIEIKQNRKPIEKQIKVTSFRVVNTNQICMKNEERLTNIHMEYEFESANISQKIYHMFESLDVIFRKYSK